MASSLKKATKFLRKHRKWPTPSFNKAQPIDSHDQRQQRRATRSILKLASRTSIDVEDDDPERPKLLSALVHAFASRNCDPTPKAYGFVLKALSDSSRFRHIPAVLGRLEAVENFETPESILIDVMKSLCDSGRAQAAVHLFGSIPKFRCVPSVLSLNALLSALTSTRQGIDFVPEVLLKSQQMGIRIEDSSLRILMKALCSTGRVYCAVDLLRCLISDELTADVRFCSIVLSALSNEELKMDVFGFLEEMRKLGFCPGLADYTNVIKYLVKIRRVADALVALNQMKLDGIKPDISCYRSVLSGIIEEGEDYERAEKIFDELLVFGLVPDIYTYNVYINGLCKQNRIEEATAMTGFMDELGCRPDETVYEIIFGALCREGELGRASQLMEDIRTNKGVGLNLDTYLTLLEGFVGQDRTGEASDLLEEVVDKRLLAGIAGTDEILCGLCERGLVSRSPELLDKVLQKGLVPGALAWEALLCSFGSRLSLSEKNLTDIASSS